MTETSGFACETCFDTRVVDSGGREVDCPDCSVLGFKLTGLAHGLGYDGRLYKTAVRSTSTTIEFFGGRREILADVASVRRTAELEATARGLIGRNSVSSGAFAIERRVRKELAR